MDDESSEPGHRWVTQKEQALMYGHLLRERLEENENSQNLAPKTADQPRPAKKAKEKEEVTRKQKAMLQQVCKAKIWIQRTFIPRSNGVVVSHLLSMREALGSIHMRSISSMEA